MPLFFALAFFIPLPLFFDLSSLSFIIAEFNPVSDLTLPGAIPLPIGLFCFAGVLLLSLFRSSFPVRGRFFVYALLNLALFFLIAISRIQSLKLLAVLLPIPLLLLFTTTVSNSFILKSISNGYFSGFLFQTCSHFLSTIISSVSSSQDWSYFVRSFFGYEIYQAWISYSAILSLAAAGLFVYAISVRTPASRFVTIICLTPVIPLIIGLSRKAALVDLLLIIIVCIYSLFSSFSSSNPYMLKKHFFWLLSISTVFAFSAYSFVSSSSRDVSVDFAIEQRGFIFDLLFSLDFGDFLFGFSSGWGGYSSLFVELIVRIGLIGLLPFCMSIFYSSRYFFSSLYTTAFKEIPPLLARTFLNTWFFVAIISLLVGNLVNMNIQLPYYAVNFLMINVCLLYFYSNHIKRHFPIISHFQP